METKNKIKIINHNGSGLNILNGLNGATTGQTLQDPPHWEVCC